MAQRLTILVCLVLGVFGAAYGADTELSIAFHDKRVYYTGAESGPILIQVTIRNHSPAPYRFRLSDERIFSIDFEARTLSNKPLAQSEDLERKRSQYQPLYFKEVTLEPGEALSFVEDLRDYINFEQSGSFIVRAMLYPELYQAPGAKLPASASATKAEALMSPALPLTVYNPPLADERGVAPLLDRTSGAILVRESMPPDQVIEYLIIARQKGEWEKFFLYIDLEEMIKRDAARKRSWQASSEEDRERIVARYRQDLQSAWVDRDIATVPLDFTIVSTSYNQVRGVVVVNQRFDNTTYILRKEYTYILSRKDNVWTVVDYSVRNLGNE